MPKPFYEAPLGLVKSPIQGSRPVAEGVWDPRQAPRLPVLETVEFALGPDQLSPAVLRQRVRQPPLWTPEFSAEAHRAAQPGKPAAVLIPVVLAPEPTVLFTQRTQHLSRHAGQIAFPGGRIDPSDSDAVHAALREAQEEVGLSPAAVEVLGRLPTYHSGSGYDIEPVVGLLPAGLSYTPNPSEVAEVFEVPLAFLMNPRHHHRHAWVREGQRREWYAMPYQDGPQERYIWGVTAALLRNLYRLLSA